MARYQPRHKRSSILRKVALGSLIFILTAGIALTVFRASVLELGLKAALSSQGLGPIEIDVQGLGPTTVKIGTVSLLGGQMGVKNLEAHYGLNLWRRGQVDSLSVTGFHLSGNWTAEGVSFGSLDRFFQQPTEQLSESSTGPADSSNQQSTFLDHLVIEEAVVSVRHPDGLITIETDLSVDGGGEENIITTNTQIQGPNIAGTIQWDGTTHDFDAISVIGTGLVQLSANAFRVPGQTKTVDLDVEVDIEAEDKNFNVIANRPLTIKSPLPNNLNLIDGSNGAETAVSISLSSDNQNEPIISAARNGEGFLVTSDLNLAWSSPMGSGTAGLVGWIDFDNENLPQDFMFERLSLSIEDTPSPIGKVTAKVSADGLRGPIAVAEGPLKFEAKILNGSARDIAFDDLSVTANTVFRLDGLSLAFDLNEFTASIDGGAYNDSVRFEQPVSVVLDPSLPTSQVITIVFGADGSATFTFDTGLRIDAPSAALIASENTTNMSIIAPSVAIDGFWVSGEPGVDLNVTLQDAQITNDLIQGRNLTAEFSGTLDALRGTISGLTGLRPRQGPARAGLPFESQVVWIDQQLTFEGVLQTDSANKLATFIVNYDASQGQGQIGTTVGPLVFGGNQLAPSDVYGLGLPFTPTSGEFGAELSLPVGDASQVAGNMLFIRDLEIEAGAVRLERMNTVLALEQIWPPLIKSDQTVSIGLVQAGVPVTNILASFSISEQNLLDIPSLEMDFAGGKISGDEFTIDLAQGREIVNLDVRGVNMDTLAQLSGLPGLQADGVLSGTIPVLLSSNDALIRDGVLTTENPGRISYRPPSGSTAADATEGGLQLALQAMEEFEYDSLSLTVSGSLFKELNAGLAIKGRNPNLYGGYPIDFNLNLSGELANIIQGSLTGYRVPESIKQQLMAFPSRQ